MSSALPWPYCCVTYFSWRGKPTCPTMLFTTCKGSAFSWASSEFCLERRFYSLETSSSSSRVTQWLLEVGTNISLWMVTVILVHLVLFTVRVLPCHLKPFTVVF